jgi:hypothetical protein
MTVENMRRLLRSTIGEMTDEELESTLTAWRDEAVAQNNEQWEVAMDILAARGKDAMTEEDEQHAG